MSLQTAGAGGHDSESGEVCGENGLTDYVMGKVGRKLPGILCLPIRLYGMHNRH